jgi:hypothetical protein
MANASSRGGLFRRKPAVPQVRTRVLTAASTKLRLKDKEETRFMRLLRQGWQADAHSFYQSIGELHYATNFKANCMGRIKLFPAAYPTGGEDDNPVPLADIEGVPDGVLEACKEAQLALGNGRLAVSNLLYTLSINMEVAGECFLLGEEDETGGPDTWTIRSTEELVWQDDELKLRELPSDPQGSTGFIELDADRSVVSRIWSPSPTFRRLALSPYRPILDDMEGLQIYRRMMRADGRSRLAQRGLLALPLEMEIKTPENDSADPETSDFFGEITEAMMMGLADEGTAPAVVPITLQGPGEQLANIRFIDMAPQFSEHAIKIREEYVGVIATGLNLPKSVVLGVQDMNHWNAYQVSDEMFRSHIEPDVIKNCDSLSGAYLRPFLEGRGIDPEWVHRVIYWYDATELVVHPDRSKDAQAAYDVLALSGEAYRREMGFDEMDAPSVDELQDRQFQHLKTIPPNLLMAWAQQLNPQIDVPPITVAGTIPGVHPGKGVDVGTPPPVPGVPGTPTTAPATGGLPTPAPPAPEVGHGPPPVPAGITASAGDAHSERLSRRLAAIDRDLRIRLEVACSAAMKRKLEQAGARVRSSMINHPSEVIKTAIKHGNNEQLPARVGKVALVAAGIDTDAIFSSDWSSLQDDFMGWTAAAQAQALATATQLAELDSQDDAVQAAKVALAADSEKAWSALENALDHLGHTLLYDPVGETTVEDLSPTSLVPTGVIRGALAVAGGGDWAYDPGGVTTMNMGVEVGQVATGGTIRELIEGAGGEVAAYEWEHSSMAIKPFEPHELLDGLRFVEFDDPRLANPGDWPAVAFFAPSDHAGCGCDVVPIYLSPSEAAEAEG